MIIAQISDPHITLQQSALGSPDAAARSLQRAVAHLLALPAQPDLVLVSGDCVDHGQPAEYMRFQELLHPLPMPVYVVPGNHDDRAQLQKAFGAQGTHALPNFVQYVVDHRQVRLIALDTLVPGRGHGELCAQRLAWLEERLAEAPTRPTIVCMHHPPFRTGLTPYDRIGLKDAGAFETMIARHPHVERIVTGHVHMAMTRRFAGTVVTTCPSTQQMLLPDTDQPERVAVLVEPPACLLHVWQESTALITYTSPIADHGLVVELHNGTQWLSLS